MTKTLSQRTVLGLLTCVLWMLQLASFDPAAANANVPMYLPWQAGEAHTVLQGNGGSFSHSHGNTYYAWDFAMPVGTPVEAAAPGTVQIASGGCGDGYNGDPCNGGWGNYVVVCHDQDVCSFYVHLSEIDVKVGDQVGQAQVVGKSGISGSRSGEAHLHFQVTHPGSEQSIPYSFVEAGNPPQGAAVTSRNGENAKPEFDPLQVFSLDSNGGVAVQAGGPPVSVDVTSTFRGPKPIPCGDAHLGLDGDGDAPFRNDAAGPWPNSPWLNTNRVQIVGCEGNGYLDPGESALWRLSFLVPSNARVGLFSTGTWSPLWENVAWSDAKVEIKLDITPPDVTPPVLTVKSRRQRLAAVRRHGLRVRATCSEACTVSAVLGISRRTARRIGVRRAHGPVLIGAVFAQLPAGQPRVLTIKLTGAARRRLVHGVHVRLTATATDASGNRAPRPVVRRYVLRR